LTHLMSLALVPKITHIEDSRSQIDSVILTQCTRYRSSRANSPIGRTIFLKRRYYMEPGGNPLRPMLFIEGLRTNLDRLWYHNGWKKWTGGGSWWIEVVKI